VWRYPPPEPNPYQLEWDDLIEAIRKDKPYNEVQRGAEASLVTIMGRMAAHTGQIVTWTRCSTTSTSSLRCRHADDGSPAPLLAGPDGKYPVPQPGIITRREYS